MTTEQIRKAQQTRPFRPFTVCTGGGREHRVPHPDFLFIFPAGRTILVVDEDGAGETIDLVLVESLHFDRTRPRRTNGRRAS